MATDPMRMTSITFKPSSPLYGGRARIASDAQVNNHRLAQRIARLLLSCLVFADRAEFGSSWLPATVDPREAKIILRTECIWETSRKIPVSPRKEGRKSLFVFDVDALIIKCGE
ncbi:hypothetical protein ABIB06_006394 [Bradyrhizobium sp. LB8.2]|uniref:hypothetical protein n=1 Tax=unclassified Bradyrhizobium TaxID=2631580 RepID=UPI00339B5B5D